MAEHVPPDNGDQFMPPIAPSHPAYPTAWLPDGGAPSPAPARVTGYVLVLCLLALIVGYGLAVVFTKGAWETSDPRAGVRATFTAHALDGSSPSPIVLSQTRAIEQNRVEDVSGQGSEVVVDGDHLVVTVPGADDEQLRQITQSGQLYIRPVIHAIPAAGSPSTAGPEPTNPSPPPADLAKQISDEKALRQSADQQIQILALQYQATRCTGYDLLTDNDDPNLPLVTCSHDGKQVYLLGKSIISGQQVENATSRFDEQLGAYVVEVQFNGDATAVWADFTAANVGTQTAFTRDTRVVSAPEINEAIPGGRTQITAQFDAASARDFAIALRHGSLPLSLSFDSSVATTLPAQPGSTPLRIGLISGAVVLVLLAVFLVLYLVRVRRRGVAFPSPGLPPPPGY